MRVIAGNLGGRTFQSPHTNRTHPMSDKVRGALFNMLGDLEGLTILDAYAGSGACSIESVSRGARSVMSIDIDPEAVKTIAANIRDLNLTDVINLRRANISGWIRNHKNDEFDVVLADPPYDDIRVDILKRIAAVAKPGGIFVLSWPGSEPSRPFPGFDLVNHKSYGDAQLLFYRRNS